ncbi:MAG TPA: YciI family protein [Candidatus Binataceae bacterium]|nr:YciI family protein [Candidatus Binataceae bacterium]
MLLIINDPKAPAIPESEMGAMIAGFEKIGADLSAQKKLIHSARLRPSEEAKTVRLGRRPSPVVVDGPFTETKEAVGGYYMIDCASQAEAIEWAKRFPPYFSIEVHPVWDLYIEK